MRSRILPLLLAVGVLGWASSVVVAGADGQQALISTGDCSMPGDPVIEPVALASTDIPLPADLQSVTQALGSPTSASQASVPLPLTGLAANDHAVRVLGQDGQILACGELGTFVPGPTDLQLGLTGADAGLIGVVWLHDVGDDTTSLSVVMGRVPETASGTVLSVLGRSSYEPNPLEVPAGTTVTWVNEDSLPHTTTATDGTFDSGYMAQGATWSYTFEAPGTYPIFCVYHPRMRGSVVVH